MGAGLSGFPVGSSGRIFRSGLKLLFLGGVPEGLLRGWEIGDGGFSAFEFSLHFGGFFFFSGRTPPPHHLS